jgi:hypothetical protein
MNRETKLKLLQKAYDEWIRLYPNENDDDPGCHLPEIQRSMGIPDELITGENEANK